MIHFFIPGVRWNDLFIDNIIFGILSNTENGLLKYLRNYPKIK